MAAAVSRAGSSSETDLKLHEAAVEAWISQGVLCSEDKHVRQANVATELGFKFTDPRDL